VPVSNSEEKVEEVSTETEESAKPVRSKHAIFDNGKIILENHPAGEELCSIIAKEQNIANLRLAENEDLILQQIESRLDESFYVLWCHEANQYFRLMLRYRKRAEAARKKLG